jgi:kynurenine formamidase
MLDVQNLARTLRGARRVDLSQTIEEHMPHFPTHSKFFHNLWGSYWHGDRALTYQLVINEHNGTHVDAPAHFISDAKPAAHVTMDRVPLDRLVGRGLRLDCRGFAERDYVPRQFIQEWEAAHQQISRDDILLFNFGWSAHWGLRPQNQRYVSDWPGVNYEAAEYLAGKAIGALGVDTLSPDPPAALAAKPIHPFLLEKQILIVENLTRLEELPDSFLFMAFPLKIGGGSGSPIRAVAFF